MTTTEARHMAGYSWARIVRLPVTLLLAITLAGCGSESIAPAHNKRLADQEPCDLAKVEELEKMFGPVDSDTGPYQEGPQCFYTFENGDVAIGRAAEIARPGTEFDIDGVVAKQFEKPKNVCSIDVWLVPGDINQQFSVVGGANGKTSCETGIAVARLILKNLPE